MRPQGQLWALLSYGALICRFSETPPRLSETRIDEFGAELPLRSQIGRLGAEEADMPKKGEGGRGPPGGPMRG